MKRHLTWAQQPGSPGKEYRGPWVRPHASRKPRAYWKFRLRQCRDLAAEAVDEVDSEMDDEALAEMARARRPRRATHEGEQACGPNPD